MRERFNMKKAREECDSFFAPNYIIVDRIKAHLQEDEFDTVFQEDVAYVLRIPPNVLAVLKNRNASSFLPFAFKWCIENGLDVAKFTER